MNRYNVNILIRMLNVSGKDAHIINRNIMTRMYSFIRIFGLLHRLCRRDGSLKDEDRRVQLETMKTVMVGDRIRNHEIFIIFQKTKSMD